MDNRLVTLTRDAAVATITFNDPARRNALGLAMFDALETALASVAADGAVTIVLVRGEGSVFCAGFDLAAAASDPQIMKVFIMRLSGVVRTLRRMPQIVVAAVQGAAIAGGCALLGACDCVFAARDARFGYPVHRLGVSPAVNIPTLQQALGGTPGAARSLLMGGELIDAAEALCIGLVTHLSDSADDLRRDAMSHVLKLSQKGLGALRTTKAWLNELDGSLFDSSFDEAASASAAIADGEEAIALLAQWHLQRNRTDR